jgi:signal transduction histidine kinase
MPLVALALWVVLSAENNLSGVSVELQTQAEQIATAAAAQTDLFQNGTSAQTFVTTYSAIIGGDVRLLQPSGELIASSDTADTIGSIESLPEGFSQTRALQITTIRQSVQSDSTDTLLPVLNVSDELVGIVGVSQELEQVSADLNRLEVTIAGILLVGSVAGGLLGGWLATRFARPIDAVTLAVEELAQGQRIEPIEPQGTIEMRSLVGSVNELAEQLHFLEEARRRLLANVIHELGRPLGALNAGVQALRRGAEQDVVLRGELLEGMEVEIGRLQPLLDDLSQLHGQLLGTLELHRVPTDINAWLPPLLLPYRASALAKGLTWEAKIAPKLPQLKLDIDRMAQAIGNLVSNAIKYTPTGGDVRVKVTLEAGRIWIKVADTGEGVVSAETERIFEPFYRSQHHKRFPQGLGLGLSIAREIVVAHGGTLTVESQLQKGSSFNISLPSLH